MPRLLSFTACEYAIVNQIDTTLSLTKVLDIARVQPFTPGPDEVPEYRDAKYILMPFTTSALWIPEPEDTTAFEESIALVAPDGRITELPQITLIQLTGDYQRVFHQFENITLREVGIYRLIVRSRPAGFESWEEKGEWLFVAAPVFVQPGSSLPD